jgi:hypothetical protein
MLFFIFAFKTYAKFMPQFLILAKDYTDPDALQRRLSVREAHLARMHVEKEKGSFVTGGAKLDDAGRMVGSMLVVDLETKESVEKWVSVDPYITGKVWEDVEILPFKTADV